MCSVEKLAVIVRSIVLLVSRQVFGVEQVMGAPYRIVQSVWIEEPDTGDRIRFAMAV